MEIKIWNKIKEGLIIRVSLLILERCHSSFSEKNLVQTYFLTSISPLSVKLWIKKNWMISRSKWGRINWLRCLLTLGGIKVSFNSISRVGTKGLGTNWVMDCSTNLSQGKNNMSKVYHLIRRCVLVNCNSNKRI